VQTWLSRTIIEHLQERRRRAFSRVEGGGYSGSGYFGLDGSEEAPQSGQRGRYGASMFRLSEASVRRSRNRLARVVRRGLAVYFSA